MRTDRRFPCLAVPLLVAGAAGAVYWRTAYPTITWWDSSNYSLAATTLGVTGSPGSLLLTLLGWAVTRVPWGGSAAHQLNVLAGAIAAATAATVFVAARRVLRRVDVQGAAAETGAALGALAFAYGATLWEHAVMLTPYVLTALFTALLLLVLVRWWDDADDGRAWRWLALLGLLFGLDFSVHRSNALLVPGAVLWVMMRREATVRERASWLAGVGGLVIGLAVQLLVMPIAAHTSSSLNMLEPSDWRRFWDYVSLAQVGGGFLVKLWPRNAPFWSVQVGDVLRTLRDDWLAAGALPAAAALLGVTSLRRRERRLADALVALLLAQAAMTVLYFNIPAGYFRSLHRHYLPVSVTIGVMAACGAGVAARWLARRARTRPLGIAAAGVVALAPAAQLLVNWRTHDASRRWFTRDFAANALTTLPPRAILFTVGDNDTFPLWYLQSAEGVRRDVRVVNLSLANSSWYVRQLVRRDPSFPVEPRDTVERPVRPLRTPDSAIVLPGGASVRPRPLFGTDYLPADAVLLDIVRTNAWRDPLCVSTTAGREHLAWLEPFARLDGLHWCLVPTGDTRIDRDLLRANLLQRATYRGYGDRRVDVDETSRNLGALSLDALGWLLDADRAAGDLARCRDDARRLFALVPPERVGMTVRERAELEGRCGARRLGTNETTIDGM